MRRRQDLTERLGLQLVLVSPDQHLITGFLPILKIGDLGTVPGFASITPVWAPKLRAAVSEGDAAMKTDVYRDTTGATGAGIAVGVISDSANQADTNRDGNPDRGLAESQRTGDLPATGVDIIQDGPTNGTDEGRGMMEVIHDIAPGASLIFNTGVYGPQQMATAIQALVQAGADVIVDDVGYVNEPMFNYGVLGQAVEGAVANEVVYVTAAGNEGDNGWFDVGRFTSGRVGNVVGNFQDFNAGAGTDTLQNFVLQTGQTLDLVLQWDETFLEGGSYRGEYQVTNDVNVLITDKTGTRVLEQFTDVAMHTDEALERVVFTNNGFYGTNEFAIAIQWGSGTAPGKLKWVRFDGNADAEYQGASTIFGHAMAVHALTVGAVNPTTQQVRPYSSVGPNSVEHPPVGQLHEFPEVYGSKPNMVAPDGVHAGQFANGSGGVFTGTSAAAAHVAGLAALVQENNPDEGGVEIAGMVQSTTVDIGPQGRDIQSGLGSVQVNTPPRGRQVADNLLTAGNPINASRVPGINESETSISINPTNPDNVVVVSNIIGLVDEDDNALEGHFIGVSNDGGRTWARRVFGDRQDLVRENIPLSGGDPHVVFDEFGNLFMVYLGGEGVVVVLSTDGGDSFEVIEDIEAEDYPEIDAGAGAVWVAYNGAGDDDEESTWFARGAAVTGLGQVGAFNDPQGVPNPNEDDDNFGDIAIGPDGTVVISWQDDVGSENISFPQSNNPIFVTTDFDGLGPQGFGNEVFIDLSQVGAFDEVPAQPERTIHAMARLAYDRSPGKYRGRVYIVYSDEGLSDALPPTGDGSNNVQVWMKCSDDNGLTWTPRVRINDDNSGLTQMLPDVQVDQVTGIVAAGWYDARFDFGQLDFVNDQDFTPNTDVHFFVSVSYDGGRCWTTNLQLTDRPSNSQPPPTAGTFAHPDPNDFGDYTGLAMFNHVMMPAWADNSVGFALTAYPPAAMDVATAIVEIPNLNLEDRFEPNDTSERAADLGLVNEAGLRVNDLTITMHGTGFPDYDWFRFTPTVSGTLRAQLNVEATEGELELWLYRQEGSALVELGRITYSGHITADCREEFAIVAAVSGGDIILAEVKGRNYELGRVDRGFYNLSVELQGQDGGGDGGDDTPPGGIF